MTRIAIPYYVMQAITRWVLTDDDIQPHHVKELCWRHAKQISHLRFDNGHHQADALREEEEQRRVERDPWHGRALSPPRVSSSEEPAQQPTPIAEPEPQKRSRGRPKCTKRFYGVPWHKKEKVVKKVKKAKKEKAQKH
jgi:hypothetical protein